MKRSSFLLAAIIFFVLALPMLLVQGQSQAPEGKFRRVEHPIPNQYIIVLNDDVLAQDVPAIANTLARNHSRRPKFVYQYAINGLE